MAKLYVFGIGGTGSRVIKSLTMLLAAGVDMNGYEIVPIIIDPDIANGDVTRTIDLLRNYQNVRSKLDFSNHAENRFFQTPIVDKSQNFRMELNNIKDDDFKGYINYGELDDNNKALINILFSEDNLNSDMEVGFKGNPNIGSVVLNQLSESQGFIDFADSFREGDRIFIISSIFGGTGAAGFPLLLKNLRNNDESVTNWAILRNAPIAAITVLPYFGVKTDEESKIEKATFISKTRAALSYYLNSVNNSLNYLYYIGDHVINDYDNHEGSAVQRNDAHFVEVAGALAIVDFAQQHQDLFNNEDGKTTESSYKEYGIINDSVTITFSDLGSISQSLLRQPLTQYLLFCKYLDLQINESLDQPWATGTTKIDKTFMSHPFYNRYITGFNKLFKEWLSELSTNHRAFAPFNLDVNQHNLFEIVKGVKPSSSFLEKGKNFGRFDYILSKKEMKATNTSVEQKFMDLFYVSTKELVKEKFKF
ncbi:MAG: hypothetical protein LUG51_09935 [Tannerellaceae bacterium]|nr:hypothetical protein [Tannerellaceae bacterium]